MASYRIVDINSIPTVVVPRGNGQSPIILYTIQPPPYFQHTLYELIDAGEPLSSIQNIRYNDYDECDDCNPNCFRLFFFGVLITIILFGILIYYLCF